MHTGRSGHQPPQRVVPTESRRPPGSLATPAGDTRPGAVCPQPPPASSDPNILLLTFMRHHIPSPQHVI
ncbi:hypothetical protein B0T16DRAFT_422050 [Cercophora newfieldiana]|uniref:Uncharacterized protein n=1 Tax=Cercophora newfieldiana TaxID=92897 RepID=A0AA40CHW2_9PEZI|nr:hypothetical protein B0T16DRAFT_422050 [Cercophora newfieldiana]